MSKTSLFGTDGIRSHVNAPHMKPENIVKLGRIFARLVKNHHPELATAERKLIALAKDTRASGSYLEHGLVAGITAEGIDCELLGILPTAALAYHTKETKAALGIMISASHNPSCDNGLKLFDAMGFKISKALEDEIEAQLQLLNADDDLSLSPGQAYQVLEASYHYTSMLKAGFPTQPSALKLVIDCAHGAASFIAPIFSQLFINPRIINASPNGHNINHNCGTEAPQTLQEEVVKQGADIGIAFDGDADRVMFVDERGHCIDGDALLFALSVDLKKTQGLKNDTIVATVMSSFALDKALHPHGIRVIRSDVGDKFVARAMKEHEAAFGGENSGHLIKFPQTTTGDGILSALLLLDVLLRSSQKASDLACGYEPTPKVFKNIAVDKKVPLAMLTKTQELISETNNGELRHSGRVMLRYSGTENKLRLLVEAPTMDICDRIIHAISLTFCDELKSFV